MLVPWTIGACRCAPVRGRTQVLELGLQGGRSSADAKLRATLVPPVSTVSGLYCGSVHDAGARQDPKECDVPPSRLPGTLGVTHGSRPQVSFTALHASYFDARTSRLMRMDGAWQCLIPVFSFREN